MAESDRIGTDHDENVMSECYARHPRGRDYRPGYYGGVTEESPGKRYRYESFSTMSDGRYAIDQQKTLLFRWVDKQWKRYDRLIQNYTSLQSEAERKALCLAFTRSVLDDKVTESIISETLFEVTENMMSDCSEAIGKENVSKSRAHLLLLLWWLPNRAWKTEVFTALSDYCCRVVNRTAVPFRLALSTTLGLIVNNIVDPIADFVEPWL